MSVVADTSPLCYLILIGEVDLLASLFNEIIVPEAVLDELKDEGAPEAVQLWAAALPDWVKTLPNPVLQITGLEKLQAGETAAILLAESIGAGTIILDEKAARRIATARGLRVIGLLGIVDEAAARGLVDPVSAIDGLKATSFRASPSLMKGVLDRHQNRGQ